MYKLLTIAGTTLYCTGVDKYHQLLRVQERNMIFIFGGDQFEFVQIMYLCITLIQFISLRSTSGAMCCKFCSVNIMTDIWRIDFYLRHWCLCYEFGATCGFRFWVEQSSCCKVAMKLQHQLFYTVQRGSIKYIF
ncbi:Hypothetical_protein [Hexamita inflata]|uniref:Hypothetical_protein n=1 Tax=Hexamita inflata TaxID=28002 RepID=A0AA86P7R7_9EUKA|nr:Hypothetical protein HINF_LOCUS20908 [Hexamita inflata]